jgi:hypothetical protein
MFFQFDSEIAKKYGVNEAIFIYNIFFWVNHNEANRKHFYKGRYWTYNTKKAFIELFPFWSYDQVRNIIKKLQENTVLLTDNFNENTWDRTTWYSLSDELISYIKNNGNTSKNALGKNPNCISEKSLIDVVKFPTPLVKNPNSYIGTDNKPYINTDREENALEFFKNNFPSRYETFLMKYKTKIRDFQKFENLIALKMEEEKTEYNDRVINARMERFAINYIERDTTNVIELNPVLPAYADKRF